METRWLLARVLAWVITRAGAPTPASGRGSSGPTGSSTVRPLLLPVERDEFRCS